MRNNSFLELVSDAFTFHRMALNAADDHQRRLARHSIVIASITIECAANCILSSANIEKSLKAEFEKLSPLSKINACLHVSGKRLESGRIEVQRMAELIKARNEYVHPKIVIGGAEIGMPQDAGHEWIMDLRLPVSYRDGLGIPKSSAMWSVDSSKRVLQHLTAFYAWLVDDVLAFDPRELQRTFSAFIELDGKPFAALSGRAGGMFEQDDDDFSYAIYRRMTGNLNG